MQKLVWVIVGSGIGGGLRYLLGGWVAKAYPGFPWGTLAVNALGSFILCFIMFGTTESGALGPELRLGLTTGMMGGFTTYSTFNYETLTLFDKGAVGLAAANLAATVLVCLAAGGLGLWIGRLFAGRLVVGT